MNRTIVASTLDAGPAVTAPIADDPLTSHSLPSRMGKFELIELLGKGSFGNVYRAYDIRLGREVAIKISSRRLLSEADGERFLREGRHLARLEHPAIVPVFEAGQVGEAHYLACGLLRGGTLRDRVRGGPINWRAAAEIAVRLAEALAAAHTAGVVHRDVTSSNILFDDAGGAFLSDFGLAQSDLQTTLTHDSGLLGTPAYMPPEQVLGESRRVDARSDVYSLGVVLYEMLTGRLPFYGHGRMVWYEKARTVREKLVRLFPNDDSLLHDLVDVRESLGSSMFACGDRDQGFEAVQSAIELRRQLVDRHPGHAEYGRRLAATQRLHASMLNELGRFEEAETSCRKAVAFAAAEVAAGRGMPYSATSQSQALILLARILFNRGNVPAARETCRQAVKILEPLAANYPSLAKIRELQEAAEQIVRELDPAIATANG